MDANPKRAREIFLAAIKLPAEEREAYVQQACGEDAALRERVLELLEAQAAIGSFHEAPVPTFEEASKEAGATIGPYRLLQKIGEGGMGEVYMAEQLAPVRRLVALKVIRPGMDSRQVIARFEAERQALALMDHPNIAKVLDGGESCSGRPYFVMELVKGVPITRFCDERRLTPRQRLELFVPVCQAVQHAHQKGVIHRDLKPSNVLVALYDGKPVPKVIDFGVAKAAGQPLTERTLITGFGAIVGTLEYMAPEQAEVNQLDIDTRSDIYSLGVLLYELLTGGPPFSRQELENAGMLEMLRVIREQEPSKPSTKLSTAEGLPTVAANRGTEPAKLTRLVRGELDWIVMKALEKDRNRRYETAAGFAADVQRYLNDERVLACPPSAANRLRKFARRNKSRLVLAGIGLVFLMLLGGAAGYMIGERATRRAHVKTKVEQLLAESERLMMDQRWPEALAAAESAEAVLTANGGDAATVRKVSSIVSDLQVVARLEQIRLNRDLIVDSAYSDDETAQEYGRAFRELGVDLQTTPVAEAASLLNDHRAILLPLSAALDDWVLCQLGRGADASRRQVLIDVSGRLDPDPLRGLCRQSWTRPVTPQLQAELRELAESVEVERQTPVALLLLGATLARARLPELQEKVLRLAQDEHPGDFWLNSRLGDLLGERKRPEEAVRFYSTALGLRPTSSAVRTKLGNVLQELGRHEEAIRCYRAAIRLDPKYPHPYKNLGVLLDEQKRSEEAIPLLRKAIELNPEYADAYNSLGKVLKDQGKLHEAAHCFRKSMAIQPRNSAGYIHMGMLLRQSNRLDEALDHYKKATRIEPKNADARMRVGVVLADQGKLDEAIDWYRKAISLDPKYALAHYNLGNALIDQEKWDEAVLSLRLAVALDPQHSPAHNNLGLALARRNKLDEAIVCYRKAIDADPENALAHYNLARAFHKRRQADEAIACYRRAIAIDPKLVSAHDNLGCLFLEQKKLDEAIACFHKACELSPKTPRYHHMLGYALTPRKDWAEAIGAYMRTLELNPDHRQARVNLARLLVACPEARFRNPELAMLHARKAIALEPPPQPSARVLGWAQYRAGMWKECLETLQKHCQQAEDDCTDWIVLALANARLAQQEALPEEQREHHRTEARRWRDQAIQQMNALWPHGPPDDLWLSACWDFRVEAGDLLGVQEGAN